MKNLEEYLILCDSRQDFKDCAKFLIKKGYKVWNWNTYTNDFDENVPSSMTWLGIRYISNNDWSRSMNGKKTIRFKSLQRKEKLKKLNICLK